MSRNLCPILQKEGESFQCQQKMHLTTFTRALLFLAVLSLCVFMQEHHATQASTPTCRGPAYSSRSSDIYINSAPVLSYVDEDGVVHRKKRHVKKDRGVQVLSFKNLAKKIKKAITPPEEQPINETQEVSQNLSPFARWMVKIAKKKFDVTGPTSTRQTNRVLFKGEKKKDCAACGVNCMGGHGSKIFKSCQMQYYYYGCNAEEPCLTIDTSETNLEAIIGICIQKAKCKVKSRFGLGFGSKIFGRTFVKKLVKQLKA